MLAVLALASPRSMVSLFAFFVCSLNAALQAQTDWPIFRGDAQLTGVSASALPEQPELLWTFEAGGGLESSPVIVANTIFAASLDSQLYAIDLQSGKLLWKYLAHAESKASPAVSNGVVYFGDESGALHAVDATTGKRKWLFQTEAGVISSANFFGERLFFGSYDNHLYCLATNGALQWKLETNGYVHATPAIVGDNVLVGGCDGYLRLVRMRDGAEMRKVFVNDYVAASAAVVGDHAYVGTFGNRVLGLVLSKGAIVWEYDYPQRDFPFVASAAATREIVIACGRDKVVHALDPQSGKALWTHSAKAKIEASPVIVGARVLVAVSSGELLALELRTGKVQWQFESGSAFVASPAVAREHLVVGSAEGVLYCFGKK